MNINSFILRIVSKYRRTLSKYLYRKLVNLHLSSPVISFSFDDAPHTSFTNGGDILNRYGAKATYYVSFGLLGCESPSGSIGNLDDLRQAVERGHELGCHTFDHKNPRDTKPHLFIQSVTKNSQELSKYFPEMSFLSHAYPISGPRPVTKKKLAKLFKCCRGGGQNFNTGSVDLNLIKSYFLDSRIQHSIDGVKKLIDENVESNGWLIFATHDIEDKPSRYGCSKSFFEEVVKYSAQSGARLLPVGKACSLINSSNKINQL